jgi:hypothetical protein
MLIQYDWSLQEHRNTGTLGEWHTRPDVEIGMAYPEVKEHQELLTAPEAKRKAWNRFSLQSAHSPANTRKCIQGWMANSMP